MKRTRRTPDQANHDQSDSGLGAQLARRREKAQRLRYDADLALARVTSLDARLGGATRDARACKAARRRARDEAANLERRLEAISTEQEQLRRSLRKARRAADKARQKATRADGKYDQAVLADLVRRAKRNAQSAAVRALAPSGGNGAGGPREPGTVTPAVPAGHGAAARAARQPASAKL